MYVTGSLQKCKKSKNWYMVVKSQDVSKPRWITTGTSNKNEANRILRNKLNEMERGICSSSKITLNELFEMYLKYAKDMVGLEYNTLRPYKGIVKNHLSPFFGDIKLQALSPMKIDDYFVLKRKTLSTGTIKQHFTVLNNSLIYAVKKHLISFNPAEHTELPTVVRKKFSVWDVETCRKFYEQVKGERYAMLLMLAVTIGARAGELCALKIEDYDKSTGYLTIGHSIDYSHTRKSTKSNRERSFKLPETIRLELERHIKQMNWNMHVNPESNPEGYLSVTRSGKCLDPKYLHAIYKSFILKHDYPDIRLHDLRHSFATYMLEDGLTDIKTVSEMLGHVKITTTQQTYQHVTKKMFADAANNIENKLFKAQ